MSFTLAITSAVAARAPMPVLADDAINIAGEAMACADDAGCPNTSICRDGFCYARKGRFVSVSPNPANAGTMTARRVCVDAPGPGDHCRWVNTPVSFNPPGPGPVPVLASNLVTTDPVFRDWSADPVNNQGSVVVHISGCAVSNGHTYIIQSLLQGADPNVEANFSPPLSLPTTDTFGDVGGAAGLPSDGAANLSDVWRVVNGHTGTQHVPGTWLKILPSGDFPPNPGSITLAEALGAVLGFQGQTYEQQPGGGPPSNCD